VQAVLLQQLAVDFSKAGKEGLKNTPCKFKE